MPSIRLTLSYPRRSGQLFDPHAGDAVMIHLQYGISAPCVLHSFAFVRNLAELEQQEAGEGFESRIGRQFNAVLRLEVAYPDGAVHFDIDGLVAPLLDALVVLVLDAA